MALPMLGDGMDTYIVSEKVKLKNPVLIEGLPGIGNVGRVAAGYLVTELKMKKFAELYSPHFLPLVILHPDSVATALKNEFFYYKGKNQDIVVVTGDTQSITSEGHYDIVEKVLDFCERIGVKTIVTLGGFAEGKSVKQPKVIGAVNDPALLKKYQKHGVDFTKDHPVGTIVGASGLLLGMGRLRGIDGLALLGQTMGFPVITDPKAADAVLHALMKVLGVKLDLAKLEKIIGDMEERIKRTEKIHKQMLEQLQKPKEEGPRYIG